MVTWQNNPFSRSSHHRVEHSRNVSRAWQVWWLIKCVTVICSFNFYLSHLQILVYHIAQLLLSSGSDLGKHPIICNMITGEISWNIIIKHLHMGKKTPHHVLRQSKRWMGRTIIEPPGAPMSECWDGWGQTQKSTHGVAKVQLFNSWLMTRTQICHDSCQSEPFGSIASTDLDRHQDANSAPRCRASCSCFLFGLKSKIGESGTPLVKEQFFLSRLLAFT